MASGMFDYGIGSMHPPNASAGASTTPAPNNAVKPSMLQFPTNMFGAPAGAPNPPPTTNTHLPPASTPAVAAPQHSVPMNSMSAALVAAAAAQTWIPPQSMAMSSGLGLGVPNAIAVNSNAVPPNLLLKQEPQTSGTTANGSWSLSNGSTAEVGLTQPSSSAGSGSVGSGARATATTRRKRPRHAVENEQLVGGVEVGGEELKEKCPLCPMKLRTRVNLQNHMRVVHKSGSEHRCLECSAEFPWKSTLDNHVRLVHRKERPFKCGRCDKAFRWSSHLQEHIWVVHEKKKPFKCEICDKAFGRKNNRTKHERKVHNR